MKLFLLIFCNWENSSDSALRLQHCDVKILCESSIQNILHSIMWCFYAGSTLWLSCSQASKHLQYDHFLGFGHTVVVLSGRLRFLNISLLLSVPLLNTAAEINTKPQSTVIIRWV